MVYSAKFPLALREPPWLFAPALRAARSYSCPAGTSQAAHCWDSMGGRVGVQQRRLRRKATGLGSGFTPVPVPAGIHRPAAMPGMDGSPQTHGKQLEVPQAGDGSRAGAARQVPSMPKLSPSGLSPSSGHQLRHCTGAASPTDTVWARGRKWGSKAPPKPDCAQPALGTRGSMGYKQPGEPLRRRVNKGISETASELVPAGRRNGTIPTPAHNREQPSPHSQAGKGGDEGKGLLQGTVPACQGDKVVAL